MTDVRVEAASLQFADVGRPVTVQVVVRASTGLVFFTTTLQPDAPVYT